MRSWPAAASGACATPPASASKLQDPPIELVLANAWIPAISADGEPRGNGEIVDLTAVLDLSAWPPGSRVICRRERPHAGAQYRFTDLDGHRFQVLLTDTSGRGNDIAALELRQRQHAPRGRLDPQRQRPRPA